jgi:hypothetical protein
MEKKVVVKGGGKNLFKVSSYDGTYYVYQVNVGLISNDNSLIGKTRSLEDALTLIRSYAGRDIEKISDW